MTGANTTILVAQADDRTREATVTMLSALGYRVLTARDTQAALAVIDSGMTIDLLLADVAMSHLAPAVKARFPLVPVLLTSRSSTPADVGAHDGRALLPLPATREAFAAAISAQFAHSDTVTEKSDRKYRLLLCEDDWLIRAGTLDMLEEQGFDVIEAADAASALSMLAQEPVDVLVTDVGLPDMSGVTLAERARAIAPDLAVVFATGHNTLGGVISGPTVQIVVKPYSGDTLARAVGSVISGKLTA